VAGRPEKHSGALMTGIGDGFYPVYARYEDMQVGGQSMGTRIAEVRIVFWP
jgi:hypothetical protein